MKEIKAYIRPHMATHVIQALGKLEHLEFSILAVRGVTSGLPREAYSFSVKLGELFEEIVKLELICRDESADHLAEIIQKAASTGRKGDGMIFIAPIDQAIRVSTGERGEQVLLA